MCHTVYVFFFFFNDTATTEIYTLSLHDALPICRRRRCDSVKVSRRAWFPPANGWGSCGPRSRRAGLYTPASTPWPRSCRSEEHTSELQSRQYLVCRLLLEKKKHNKQSDSHEEPN